MAARAAVRDVGRVLGMPYNDVDTVAKLIPRELGITIDKALKSSDLRALYETTRMSADLLTSRAKSRVCRATPRLMRRA